MNNVYVIYPKRSPMGVWTFTDESVGLTNEPFVGIINQFMDYMTKDIENADNGFPLYFSESKLPNTKMTLHKVEGDSNGTYYAFEELDMQIGWLCPALLKYFKDAPNIFYVGCEKELS